MDSPIFQFGDQENVDVKLNLICSDGHPYSGNPIYLHSQVLKKSGYFEVNLSDRWSRDMSSPSEITFTVPPAGSVENYIDCIRLMYSSDWEEHVSFSNIDDAIRILPVASELLFQDGIQACMKYLEAVFWTPKQKLRIRALLSSLQVTISTDLAERLKISKSFFYPELEVFKKIVPQMLSEVLNKPFVSDGVPLQHMQDTVKKQILAYFQEDMYPAVQYRCTNVLLDKFKKRIDGIKLASSSEIRVSACKSVLWLLDLIKLCKKGVFEYAFTIFVEDEGIADILAKPKISWPSTIPNGSLTILVDGKRKYNQNFSDSDRSYSRLVLDILVYRFLDALANGDIIIPKPARVSFLKKWVPVIAYLICRFACAHNARELIDYDGSLSDSPKRFSSQTQGLKLSKRFEEGVTKIIASLPPNDQKQSLNSFAETAKKFHTWERRICSWWIKVIWIAVMTANSSHLQIE